MDDEELVAPDEESIEEMAYNAVYEMMEGPEADAAGLEPVTVEDFEDEEEKEDPEERRAAIRALYGESCPLAKETEVEQEEWGAWASDLWSRHEAGMVRRMHTVYRNRLFRKGTQWVTASGSGPWREPPRPRDSVRAVHNMVQPALDQRVQIVTEQRPGFRTKPITQDTDDLKKAEAQQIAIEYQYDQQQMERIIREATYWSGTDGVAFLHTFWDPDAGPWDELSGRKQPVGDLRTRVHKIEEVRVSANAKATEKPSYWVIRNIIPFAEAARRYGSKAVSEIAVQGGTDTSLMSGLSRLGLEQPGEYELYEDQQTVEMFTVYCEPSEYLPGGLQMVSVGKVTVFVDDLPFGVVPMSRFTDGSTDPAFYPQAVMDDWLEHQMRVNTLISRSIESIRTNSGGKFLIKPGVLSAETLIGGLISAIEVRSSGNISDSIVPVQPFSVGNDVKEMLAFEIKAFEQKSGWNDASRGSISANASGRAILAIREQLERIFAPTVSAASTAMTDWARISLYGMKWGYDLPRNVGVFGKGRPDLAREVESSDFDGVCDVEIDPETLMPMPRALRLFLLDQMYEKGQMPVDEYRRRMPFAFTRNLQSPDDDHDSRARRIADAIKRGVQAPPVRWQDNESIHQNVLEREIILNDSLPEEIIQVAHQRWVELANQVAQKQGGQPPQGGGGPPQAGPGANADVPNGDKMPPGQQPFLATDPGVAAAPVKEMAGVTEGMGFDFTNQM